MSVSDHQLSHYTERLLQKLKQLVHFPITLLVSPSGFGKSYIVQQYVKISHHPICRVTIESKHRYLKEFMIHLTDCLNQSFPTVNWNEINHPIYPSILFDEDITQKWLNDLINRVKSIDKPVILILENYDMIEEDSFIHRLLHQFMNMLPSNLHLVITSQFFPTGEAYKLAQLQNRLLEINEQDLRLTTPEIKALFDDQYHIPLTSTEVEHLYKLTLGWKMPLHAAYLYVSRGGKVEQIVQDPLHTLPTFFKFIEDNMFKTLPSMIQGFLYELSIFEEIDLDLLNDVFHGSGLDMLASIEKHRLLLHTDITTQKKLHPIIKAFLASKSDRKALKQINRKASYYYLKREDYAASIPFLIGAQEWEELAYLISTLGGRLIYLGHLKVVMEGIKSLPVTYKTAFPRTMIVEGDYYRLHSDYNTALHLYQSAFQSCSKQGDDDGAILAVEGEVSIYLDTVKPNKAQALLKQAYQEMKVTPKRKARLIHLMAENYINSGKPRRAKHMIRLGRKLFNSSNLDVQESRLLLRTGQLQAVDAMLHKEDAKQKEETPLIHGFRETSLVHSIVSAFMGQSEIAKKRAQQGILLGTQMKSPFIEATGWARMGHAMQIVTRFNFQLTEQCYLTALQIFEEIGVDWGQAEPLMGLTLLHGFAGNYDIAITYGMEACRISSGVTDNWMYHMTKLCMGIATFNKHNYSEALSILNKALIGIRKCGDHFLEAIILLWISYTYMQLEDEAEAVQYFDKSLDLISCHSYEFIFLKQSLFGARDLQSNIPLLLEIQQQKRSNHAFATKILQELGFSQTKFHPGYTLKIDTLGGFRVWLGDREILEKDWQRANAKRLFQYLITKRKQEIPKEVIQTDLWPELDEDTLDRDFKVALNALTKALEPDRKARTSSFYIIRNGSTYRLNPDSGYQLDSEIFHKLYEDGLKERDAEIAKQKLEAGYALYKGDFIADNLYEDWAIEERERLQVLYLKGCEKLAHLTLHLQEYEKAIKIAEGIIEKDPCWEEAYRIIMLAYSKLMNRTMALRWYEKCRQNLIEELSVEPMQLTRNLKEQIQNGIDVAIDPLL